MAHPTPEKKDDRPVDFRKFAKDDTAGAAEMMAFDEKLFWISSLVDALRDGVKEQIALNKDREVPASAFAQMRSRYQQLRDEAHDLLDADEAARLLEWTRDIDPDDEVTGPELFDASSTLARCLDTVINVPAFVASRVHARTEMHMVFTQAGVTAEGKTPDAPAAQPVPAGSGQYL